MSWPSCGATCSETPAALDPDRDRFVLAKGHAALCLYAALRWHGLIDEETFRTFCTDGSLLGRHPEPCLPGIEVATGSLGQGLSVALRAGARAQGPGVDGARVRPAE